MTTAMQQKPQQTQLLKPAQPAPSRMTLSNVRKGRLQAPRKVVLYGPEGIGKSTFGAGAPDPIFLGAEDGTQQLDVARFPKPETLADAQEAIRVLTTDEHAFKTLVIDTLDWLEPLIWRHLCRRHNVDSIEDVGGGYGKGYTAAVDEWRTIVGSLERLQAAKGMHVVFLAHSHIKPFKNPAGEDFDRYELKLNAKAAGIVKEWSDAVLFANYETYAKKDERTKRVRGVSTGARLLYTTRTAAFDAKNRYGLPEELPLSWADFAAAAEAGQVASPEALREEIARKAAALGDAALEKLILETTAKAGDNTQVLAQINNRVNARLAEREATLNAAAETTAEKAS